MAFVYRIHPAEREVLQEAFGPGVTSVRFLDTEQQPGAFVCVQGYDGAGLLLGEVELARSRSPQAARLRRLAQDRDMTVGFWLELGPVPEPSV